MYLHVIQGQRFLQRMTGIVEHVEAKEIRVRRIETVDGKEVQGDLTTYRLDNFIRSNQGTCYNQRPIVSVGDRVETELYSCRWSFNGKRRTCTWT